MQIIKQITPIKNLLSAIRAQGKSIGFVPTMGALHEGHLSLVTKAAQETDFVVVSIFVNPTQFNDKRDLERYPRDLDKDIRLLGSTNCQLVFAPEINEMYPSPDNRVFDFGTLETTMEGEHRPGHFNGVAQVVSKLFDIIEPDKAFFGLKDFQQLVIIKALIKQLHLPVELIACPIVREADGLAMSSRNMLLTEEQRKNAPHIYRTLTEAKKLANEMTVNELKKWVIAQIDQNEFLKTEYFEIVDDTLLEPVLDWKKPANKVGCIAVHCGSIRLIDNIIFTR